MSIITQDLINSLAPLNDYEPEVLDKLCDYALIYFEKQEKHEKDIMELL